MDNLTPTDNQAQESNASTATMEQTASQPAVTDNAVSTATSWKSHVRTDLRDSPLVKKFEDTPEGLSKALESHANLEKLLGNEKVPIPKDINDVEGWNRFSKALGIPDKAEGYGLPDPNLPGELKNHSIDKAKFAEIVHSHKLTPAQAKGLWKVYNDLNVESYNKQLDAHQKQLETTVNQLKSEWGDAYNTNVELGQMVINKFSEGNSEMNDYLTAMFAKDPMGIKFLAKIGEQFAENKIGEFQAKRFSMAPEEAQNEIDKILRDQSHPYNDPKATDRDHEAAINYVNSLYESIARARG